MSIRAKCAEPHLSFCRVVHGRDEDVSHDHLNSSDDKGAGPEFHDLLEEVLDAIRGCNVLDDSESKRGRNNVNICIHTAMEIDRNGKVGAGI